MDKLEEMWAALTAYQPQADAAGHGATWAKMCKEKTAKAAADANAEAADTATYADKAEAAAARFARAAYYANYAADDAYYAADADDDADAHFWAQQAIERINKATLKEENT